MKKIIFGLFIVLLCVVTIGCGNKKDGSTFEITLPDSASSGYKWSDELSEKGIVEVTSKTDYSSCPKNTDGCSGKQIYTLKALKPGSVTLTLTYAFFDDSKDREKYKAIYEITVDDDLKITETHSGSYFDTYE